MAAQDRIRLTGLLPRGPRVIGALSMSAWTVAGSPTRSPRGPMSRVRSAFDAVRDLLRAPAPAAVGRRRRGEAAARRARSGRARRPARLRLRLGGRAPLPRGVLALLGLRGVPRRGLAAHQAHPARLRDRRDAARATSTRRASPRRSRRSTSSRAAASSSGRGRPRPAPSSSGFRVDRETKREQWAEAVDVATRMMVEEPFAGYDGRWVTDADAQRRPQAQAEAAPAAVGRVLAARDDPPRRREAGWAR